jgi:hypothetical protein
MKTLMRLALRLYPDAWRSRYGPEVEQLIEDGHASPADLVDLIVHAPSTTTLQDEISRMNGRLAAHPTRLALVAAIVMLPTAFLVGIAVLKYILGVPGPFDSVEPTVTPIVTHPLGETILVLAPYVAFVLAVVPFTRLRFGFHDRRLAASAEASVPLTNLLVGALGAALIVFMGIYWMAENL